LTCKHPFVARGGIAAIGAEAATATQIGKFRSTPNITLRPTTDDDRFRAAAYQIRTGLAAGGGSQVRTRLGSRPDSTPFSFRSDEFLESIKKGVETPAKKLAHDSGLAPTSVVIKINFKQF
jgi:hypothetical protein